MDEITTETLDHIHKHSQEFACKTVPGAAFLVFSWEAHVTFPEGSYFSCTEFPMVQNSALVKLDLQ